MIDVRLALRSILVNDSLVFSLTASGANIYPMRMPQGLRAPSIVYTKVTERGDYSMKGLVNLMNAQYQVDCWAETQELSSNLSNAAHVALTGFKSSVLPVGSNSPEEYVNVQGIFLNTGRELFDASERMFRSSRDYMVWYLV